MHSDVGLILAERGSDRTVFGPVHVWAQSICAELWSEERRNLKCFGTVAIRRQRPGLHVYWSVSSLGISFTDALVLTRTLLGRNILNGDQKQKHHVQKCSKHA